MDILDELDMALSSIVQYVHSVHFCPLACSKGVRLFPALSALFLLGLFFLTAVNSAFRRIHYADSEKQLRGLGKTFFYRRFHLFFFPKHQYESLFFAIICAQNIVRFLAISFFLLFLLSLEMSLAWLTLSMLAFMLALLLIGDCLPRILGGRFPDSALQFCTPAASFFLFLSFPLTYLFLKAFQAISNTFYYDISYEPIAKAQQEVIEMMQKSDFGTALDAHDKKLLESVMHFKERIAREVMVPRVGVFSLSADTTIREAARLIVREGYSRVPVYRNTVDNIVGVLMYKDVLSKYCEYEMKGNDPAILAAPIESIQKSVLHIPETKKLSSLLQEFRKKQVHMAIVVDEYGGTQGIVTIEDILEEIVGEISDEYDQEAQLFYPQPDGTWIVDARMNILDAEEELGIKIPEEGDYDTIGGYIFHKTGTIPSKGFEIHHDAFEMEVLSSNDRCVEKVRIKPISNPSIADTEAAQNESR